MTDRDVTTRGTFARCAQTHASAKTRDVWASTGSEPTEGTVKQLNHRVAVVTGAGSGIGRAIALRLAQEGCQLALADLDEAGLVETSALLEPIALPPSRHLVDVSSSAALVDLAETIAREHGRVEILVNNAGVNIHGAFASHTVADIDWILGVNLRGVLYGCHAFLPLLKRASAAHVVNIASLAGMVPFPMQTTYCASKYGVRGFSAALRMELAPLGIGVTAVLPGAVRTPLLGRGRSYDTHTSARMSELMLRHGQRPERIAAAVVRAVQRNRAEIVLGPDAHLSRWLHRFTPSLLSWALQQASQRIPMRPTEDDPP